MTHWHRYRSRKYAGTTAIKSYFCGILIFTLISLAYVDKVLNYSGAYTKVKFQTGSIDYSIYDIEFAEANDTVDSGNETAIDNATNSSTKYHTFTMLSYGHGEAAFFVNSSVCVVGTGEQRRIVVFDAEKAGSRELLKFYKIEMKTEVMPANATLWKNSMAAFLTTRWVNIVRKNLFHFFNDFFVTYATILQRVNPLGSDTHNYMFMPQPSPVSSRLRFFLEATNTIMEDPFREHDLHQIPEHTCFDKAAFAYAGHPPANKKRQVQYSQVQPLALQILQFYNMTDKTCGTSSYPSITILQRNDYRTIQNLQEVTKTLSDSFHGNVIVVFFKKLTFREMLRTVFCTDILIGVQGAELTWTLFLRPSSSLIEIAWPAEGWPFYFSTTDFQRRWYQHVMVYQVESKKVVLPPRSNRFSLKIKKRKISKKNGRKFANVFVSTSELRQTIHGAVQRKTQR